MKFNKFTGIILKKQNYREADQIITFWSREAGKIRFLAKGIRLPKSKLAYSLQDLSVVEVQITGKNLPSLTSANSAQQFNNIALDLKKSAIAFYAVELMLKFTADEHPNYQVYELFFNFLNHLNNTGEISDDDKVIDIFALQLAKALGFGSPQEAKSHREVREFIEDLIERKIKSDSFYQLLSTN